MYNIDNILGKIRRTVASHNLGTPGAYARWTLQNEKGTRQLGLNEYGCADAANILYTIGDFPTDAKVREGFVTTMQKMQNPMTGLFTEATHHPIHTTAHCSAALELFDAKPLHPYHDLEKYKVKENLYDLLVHLDWTKSWSESHKGAGIYAAFANAGQVSLEWKKWYFDWLWEHASPETGFWMKGQEATDDVVHQMAGGFHYFFNHEHAHMPVRYPEKMIDACLEMYNNKESLLYAIDNKPFGRKLGFIEIDWVYCITRALRKTPHRYAECMQALHAFADTTFDYLEKVDEKNNLDFDDLHMLFGTVCTLAELQQALPGYYISTKPLKLVLDRRPFI